MRWSSIAAIRMGSERTGAFSGTAPSVIGTRRLLLIRLFQQATSGSGQPSDGGSPRSDAPRISSYLGFMPSPKSKQCLERSHRRLPPIVTKDEFIQVDLELVAADAVMSPKEPLLEIANGPVRQRHYRLHALSQ